MSIPKAPRIVTTFVDSLVSIASAKVIPADVAAVGFAWAARGTLAITQKASETKPAVADLSQDARGATEDDFRGEIDRGQRMVGGASHLQHVLKALQGLSSTRERQGCA